MPIFRTKKTPGSYLEGHCLIAMPNMPDPKMEQSVLFLCAHSNKGAMALCLNKLVSNITFFDLLRQLRIRPQSRALNGLAVQFGGPVETGRGFVLHSPDYAAGNNTTVNVGNAVGLTATVDVLKAIADGKGPKQAMVALGYAGWGAGQLDREMTGESWFPSECTADILFNVPADKKWAAAYAAAGVDASHLVSGAGSA